MKHIKEKAEELRNKTGIYCLIDFGKIVYIGQSTNMYLRILEHISDGKKTFNDIVSIERDDKLLVEIVEVMMIVEIRPIYNKLILNSEFVFLNTLPSIVFKIRTKSEYREERRVALALIREKIATLLEVV